MTVFREIGESERERGGYRRKQDKEKNKVSLRARERFEKKTLLHLDLVPPRRELRRDGVHNEQVAPPRDQRHGQDLEPRAHAALPGRGGGEEGGGFFGRRGGGGDAARGRALSLRRRRRERLLLLLQAFLSSLSRLRGRCRARRGSRGRLPRGCDGKKGRGGGRGCRQKSQGEEKEGENSARHFQ